ncbi:unnamed protein product [Toxocara canis]|uniref:REM-1 domain-containing protein n=1 Tax=Toxocara canis TaxID=6265 RepID=A0A183U7D9_TOXCA|nr:unnamed protein product [Toxocara canis]
MNLSKKYSKFNGKKVSATLDSVNNVEQLTHQAKEREEGLARVLQRLHVRVKNLVPLAGCCEPASAVPPFPMWDVVCELDLTNDAWSSSQL